MSEQMCDLRKEVQCQKKKYQKRSPITEHKSNNRKEFRYQKLIPRLENTILENKNIETASDNKFGIRKEVRYPKKYVFVQLGYKLIYSL